VCLIFSDKVSVFKAFCHRCPFSSKYQGYCTNLYADARRRKAEKLTLDLEKKAKCFHIHNKLKAVRTQTSFCGI
jgi:hypothetical protein